MHLRKRSSTTRPHFVVQDKWYRSRINLQLLHAAVTRNSAVADKPRDAFVQMQWRGSPPQNTPLLMCYHAIYGALGERAPARLCSVTYYPPCIHRWEGHGVFWVDIVRRVCCDCDVIDGLSLMKGTSSGWRTGGRGVKCRIEYELQTVCGSAVKLPINSSHLEEIFVDGRECPMPVHLQIRQRTPVNLLDQNPADAIWASSRL